MTPAEKKKLTVAAALLAIALGVFVVFNFAGGGGPSREEQEAQQKLLEKLGDGQAAPPEEPVAPAPAPDAPPAGMPRSVRPRP